MNENAPTSTLLQIDGMTCGSCVRHVDGALRGVDGVTSVDVQRRAGTALVHHDAARSPVQALIDAVRDAGYDARPREV